MRFSRALLLLAATLCFCSLSRADSVGASGTYEVSGFASLVGNVPMGCGLATCVETWQFSFFLLVQSDGSTNCSGGPCYLSQVVGGPGVTAAIGPMGGPWEVNRGSPMDIAAFLAIDSPTVDLELNGFYSSLNWLPQSNTADDWAYQCLDPACLNFFGHEWSSGYQGIPGDYTETVKQVPEPPSAALLLAGLIVACGTLRAWPQLQSISRKLSLQNPANN